MKEGKTWKGTFCGKCTDCKPNWNDNCKMCPRWHINGNCFKDCKNAASHVPENEVSNAKELEFIEYMETVHND
eukprot:14551275-Ditylum_brightwellii.AAC.1